MTAFETIAYDDERPRGPGSRAASSEWRVNTSLDWLKKQPSETPFLIFFAPPVPHDPRVAPPRFHRLYDPERLTLSKNFMPEHPFDNGELGIRDELLAPFPRDEGVMKRHLADYYATISNLDFEIGRLIASLAESGRLETTLVIFTSDHGLAVGGRHGLMGKQNLYEHVKPPLILAGPGVPAGRSAALVYLFDLLPTLCEYAGLTPPPDRDGKSLLPIVRGEKSKTRDYLLAAYRSVQRTVRDGRWKLIAYSVDGRQREQLFDLANDPDEMRDLAADPAAASERKRLERQLPAERAAFGDPVDFKLP